MKKSWVKSRVHFQMTFFTWCISSCRWVQGRSYQFWKMLTILYIRYTYVWLVVKWMCYASYVMRWNRWCFKSQISGTTTGRWPLAAGTGRLLPQHYFTNLRFSGVFSSSTPVPNKLFTPAINTTTLKSWLHVQFAASQCKGTVNLLRIYFPPNLVLYNPCPFIATAA